MREILFRGKAINRDIGEHRTNYKNGDWVYGLVTRLYDERFENLPAQMTDVNGVSGIEVDYETIGQYTGLTGSGKRIFEGDIVITKAKSCEFVGCIAYSTEYVRFLCVTKSKNPYPMDSVFDYEIIGNVYDNPELLKGE